MDLEDWLRISTTIPGPYTDLLAEKAKQRKVWIAANMLEVHPDFPRRFFNASFIVDPAGKIVLKHWKNNNNTWVFPYTTPSDIYSAFIAKFGRENLFPVARTEIGNLGCLTCGELGFPENALHHDEWRRGPPAPHLGAQQYEPRGRPQLGIDPHHTRL